MAAEPPLPPLPPEGLDPWFEARAAFDTAVRENLEGRLSNAQLLANYVSTYTGTDSDADTVAINALLGAGVALGARKTVRVQGKVRLAGALVVPSGTVLDSTGASIAAGPSHTGCLVRNAGAFPVASGTGSITAGSAVLTTSLTLTVGQTVTIAGADGAGTTVHTGTVISIGTGTVTIDAAAKTTVTGATVKVFTRDADVHIIGGVWDRGAVGPGTSPGGQHIIYLRHLDGFTVDVEGEKSTGAKYACSVGSVSNGSITMRGLAVNSDGLHIIGPAKNLDVPLIQGTTGDDAFAITGADWVAYGDTAGDVIGVTVGDIQAVAAAGLFKVISGSGYRADLVKVRGQINGVAATSGVFIGNDTGQPSTTGGTYGDIDFGTLAARANQNQVILNSPNGNRVRGRVVFNGKGRADYGIRTYGTASGLGSDAVTLKNLDIEVEFDTTGALNGAGAATAIALFYKQGPNFTIGTVRLRGRYLGNATGGNIVNHAEGTVNDYVLDVDATMLSTSHGGVQHTNGVIGSLSAVGGTLTGASNIYKRDSTTGSATVRLVLGNRFKTVGCSRVADVRAGTTTVMLDGPMFNSLVNAAFFTNGGTYVIDGRYQKVGSAALIQRAGTESIRLLSTALEADLSILAKNNGDAANNTNASLSCGVGPAVSNGTNWKNLYSGSTY